MIIWKVHIFWQYSWELINNQLIDCLRVELWTRTPDFAVIPGDDDEMLALLYVPASSKKQAINIGVAELDQALMRFDLPGITTFEASAKRDKPKDRPLTHGIKGLVIRFD